ncbi:MAG TPA: hypothetical protein VFC67_00680 [Prolixibacteraceae bacterium]|nr:hypothetical protein [Prolixibacteraceae bacterium]
MITQKKKVVKMNLSLDWEFYQLLKQKAAKDFMKVATWTKRFLMRRLVIGIIDPEVKGETKDGREME